MMLLDPPADGPHLPVVAVFGTGLIGSSLVGALRRRATLEARRLELSWDDPEEQTRHLADIERALVRAMDPPGAARELRVVWCAGRAGFEASEGEVDAELAGFARVLSSVERVAAASDGTVGAFLTSSAGGLFEGQRHVDRRSEANPQRPYGRLKRRQEELLAAATCIATRHVYRLTSVYGSGTPRQRRGLVATLVLNGLLRRETHIIGRMSTLRDYTWLEDVTAYLARKILTRDLEGRSSEAILASLRPYSLFELQRMVETSLGRKLYVNYSHEASNAADITFSEDVLPRGWRPSDVRANLDRICRNTLSQSGRFLSVRD